MKIVAIDNFGRETIPDLIIAENVNETFLDIIINLLNDKFSGETSNIFFIKKEDDYVLSKGMADLI